jgi:hypothetical protein
MAFAGAVLAEIASFPYGRRAEKLASAELAEEQAKVAELQKFVPRSVEQRLQVLLDIVDERILLNLLGGTTKFHGEIPVSQFDELRRIAKEPGADAFISIETYGEGTVTMGDGIRRAISFTLKPELLRATLGQTNLLH